MLNKNIIFILLGYIAVGIVVAYVFIKDAEVEAETDQAVAVEMSLGKARQAFWAQDMVKAEQLYQEVANSDGSNINAWGELGNIYYMQSKWPEAAKAYTEVALLLIEKNDMPQAAFFHELVNQMDPAQSERINERLQKLNSTTEDKS